MTRGDLVKSRTTRNFFPDPVILEWIEGTNGLSFSALVEDQRSVAGNHLRVFFFETNRFAKKTI
jgi:hypothetical protein